MARRNYFVPRKIFFAFPSTWAFIWLEAHIAIFKKAVETADRHSLSVIFLILLDIDR